MLLGIFTSEEYQMLHRTSQIMACKQSDLCGILFQISQGQKW